MVKVRWTGAAGLEFTDEGKTILIDPYHSRVRKSEIFFRQMRPKTDRVRRYIRGLERGLSSVIIGHTHFDHALDVPEVAKYLTGPLIGSQSLATLMGFYGEGAAVTVCKKGERIELPGEASVTMLPSRHGLVFFGRVPYRGDIDHECGPPLKARDYRLGDIYIPKLELDGAVFMHVGSANFIESEMEGHRCDVLFMCVPGWNKVPEYCTRLLEIVRPEIIVPFHFDDFSLPIDSNGKVRGLPFRNVSGFLRHVAKGAPHAEIRLVKPFEPMFF
jgi:L-ascorbate metabolism protein UlaG (beta-lactamase superfamily)